MNLPELDIKDYDYPLPEENIAQFPSGTRGGSKLLLAHKKPFATVSFSELKNHIPHDSLLIFNETKVIPARLIFTKPTGARIEIFLLQPDENTDYQIALATDKPCVWNVLIGNASKWKEGCLTLGFTLPDGQTGVLSATRIAAEKVRFEWTPEGRVFSEILDILARVPLPPYIHRDTDEKDRDRYQTVFARNDGSVAAPTAGLHFTDEQLQELRKCGIKQVALTLHVGLGTFRPVKESIADHEMHNEPFYVSPEQLKTLAENADKPWIVVGTTTLRALESLYVYAGKIAAETCIASTNFNIQQWDKWHSKNSISRKEAFETLNRMAEKENSSLTGNTSLFITKGKPVRTADFLITNFHQPKSTLLMLVDAFASEDWREAYDFALKNDMRFLSYGDACLFRNIQ
ncbi:S-adenosylmethionine:tRNA ribosyltransferase-isomerase [bioreactor metagenome]|uniref:S-adenosylmethionine:tRNA ribosyltransferase-isomerase n=1 Tax=bioreactor metagenome TaxID=1076179 RepID=A0A644X293_9ZZZZ